MDMDRRTLIVTGGALGAAAALAACGGGGDDAASGTSPEPTASSPESSSASSTAGESSPAAPSPSVDGEVLGPVDQVPVQGGVIYDGPKVVVTQPVEGDFRGFSAVCPHQGCLMSEVSDNVIVCPCHNSLFSAEDSALISGPSPTGIPPVSISVVDGNIILA